MSQKITEFDNSNVDTVRTAIDAAIQTVAQEYGLQLKAGNLTYSPTNCTVKIECSTKGEGGEVNTREAEDFKRYCSRYELQEEDLNKVFVDTVNGLRYKIVGCKPRSTKYPIIVRTMDTGARYKFPATRVKRAIDALSTGV
jgi:hypothetical protein